MAVSEVDISVIVPVYNAGKYLIPCLDSILRSTKRELQIILIDDGSFDGSERVADSYAGRFECIEVHHTGNQGVSAARNFGATLARGKYLAFVDSDDLIVEDAFERMFAVAEHYGSNLTLCNLARYSDSRGVYRSAVSTRVFPELGPTANIEEDPELLFGTSACNKLIRRDFFLEHGFEFPVGRHYEDIQLAVSLLCRAGDISVVRGIGYLWRWREDERKSTTQQRNLRGVKDKLYALECVDMCLDDYGAREALLRAWAKVRVEVLLASLLDECTDDSLDRGEAEALAGLIREYANSSFGGDFGKMRPHIDPAAYFRFEKLLAGDLAGVRRIRSFQRDYYAKLEVRQEDLTAAVPAEIFGIDRISMVSVIKAAGPVKRVETVVADGSCLTIRGCLHFPRVSMPELGDQCFAAFLANDVTGQLIPVCVEPVLSPQLTASKGTLRDSWQNKDISYCYDGCGFEVRVDLSEPDLRNELIEPRYHVRLEWSNRLGQGYVILDNYGHEPRPSLIGKTASFEGFVAREGFLRSGELFIHFERSVCEMTDLLVCDDAVEIKLSQSSDSLLVQPAKSPESVYSGSFCPVAPIVAKRVVGPSNVFRIPFAGISSPSGFRVFAEVAGAVHALSSPKRNSFFLPWGGGALVCCALKDGSVRLLLDRGAYQVSRFRSLGSFVLLGLSAVAQGPITKLRGRCSLVGIHEKSGEEFVLGSGMICGAAADAWILLHLGSGKSFGSLSGGLSRLVLRAKNAEGRWVDASVLCGRKVSFQHSSDGVEIKLFRHGSGRLCVKKVKRL